QVPVVAVLGSGGGIRAMLSLLGSMEGLQETGLLDCVTYICGVSGSTWAMSQLYEEVDWSTKLPTKDISDKLVGEDFSWEYVKELIFEKGHLRKRMVKAASKEVFSLTDIWAATVSYLIGTENTSTLSNHQESANNGQNPYPVYAAIDKDTFDSEKEPHPPETWFEFTPHECGFPCHGIFVETSDFGSKFENGVKTEHHSEPDMCLLQGLWGSAMGDLTYLWHYLKDENINNIHNVIKKEFLSLVDAGLAINCAYPLMLQEKRKVDVIISLDYSNGDVFMTLNQAKAYADAYNLPFPPVDKKGQKPQDCNVYSDASTPTVIHMPLFNDSNKNGK
ncbi:PA24C phospholipase, partial [Polypterus senegalus]